MLKCPFCHFDNEDGALFCEQCKSDLAVSAATAPMAAVPMAAPIEAMPMAAPMEAVPMAVPMEAVPMAVPMEAVPMAAPMEAMPMAAPMEAAPFGGFDSGPFAAPMEPIPAVALDVAPLMPAVAPLLEAPAWTPPPAPVIPAAPVMEAPLAPPPPPPAPAPVAVAPAPAPAAPSADGALPPGAQPRLVVLRGQKRNVEYPIYDGYNYIGRADEKPVDIDLEDQEPPDRVWSSRQHALITMENNRLQIEDLNSSNGTFVNRTKIYPGQPRPLNVNDVIQIGTVQMKVIV